MTECEDIARAIRRAIGPRGWHLSMDAARAIVRDYLPDEGETLRDNVSWALHWRPS